MVMLVGGIAVFAGVGIAFLVASFVNSSFGYQATQRAFDVASAGASDAMLQLVRNKDFTSNNYVVPLDTYQASVSVVQDSPAADQATITSQATVSGYKRKVQTIVAIDQITGQVVIVSSRIIL